MRDLLAAFRRGYTRGRQRGCTHGTWTVTTGRPWSYSDAVLAFATCTRCGHVSVGWDGALL